MRVLDQKKLPASVTDVADMLGVARSTIYDWIDDGFLVAESQPYGKGTRRMVVSGQPPLRIEDWMAAVREQVLVGIGPHLYGFNGSQCEVLRGDRAVRFDAPSSVDGLEGALANARALLA